MRILHVLALVPVALAFITGASPVGAASTSSTSAQASVTGPPPEAAAPKAPAADAAAPAVTPGVAAKPLEQLLRPDGSIDLTGGFRGSIATAGWRMFKTIDGQPRFARSGGEDVGPGDLRPGSLSTDTASKVASWDDRFLAPWGGEGTDGAVYALLVDGFNLYVGGYFTTAGGVSANNVAKWDGVTWSPLGSGTTGAVVALAMDGDGNLYAGGAFLRAGGVIVSNIARWDGLTWSPLAQGTSSSVTTMAVDGSGHLYAGGDFLIAGATLARNVAMWDGTTWYALGTGTDNSVTSIVLDDSGNLFAAGAFTLAGDVSANHVAKWDGTGWSPLGLGADGDVFCLAVNGSDLYMGGPFTGAGGVSASHVAKWDGTSWTALGAGTDGEVWVLAVDAGGNLYAGGTFHTAGGGSAEHLAKWDGMSWTPLGSGADGDVYCLAADGSDLYAGGPFTGVGGVSANHVAKWDGTTWLARGLGMSDYVYSMLADGNGNLYVGGEFTTAGGCTAAHIARWDGTSWSRLGSGIDGNVRTLALDGDGNLYAGGLFSIAGGQSAIDIAKWDGSAWSALGSGMNGVVYDLVVDGGGNLYAGGRFSIAGGVFAPNIARWDGASWSPLGLGTDGDVYALAIDGGGNLYAGGNFTLAGGQFAGYIARWDGTTWSAVGPGMDGRVRAIVIEDDEHLYAGGQFTVAGGVGVNHIARWDGTNWSPLGSGMDGYVITLASDGVGNLYAGGWFTSAGGASANYIAKWDGASWSALGPGTSDHVLAAVVDDRGDLDVGGLFTTAGSIPSSFFGIWHTGVLHINATAGAGGSIDPSGDVSVPYGADQAFAIVPDAGHRVADVRVDDVSVGPVTEYTFSAVTANHAIAASFTPVGACCLHSGACTVTTAVECTGSWHGEWTSCDPNPCSGAALLLHEDFDFVGSLATHGWAAHSGGGTNAIATTAPGLVYPGYPCDLGNAASMTTSGEDDNRGFAARDSGSVYYAFLVDFSAAQATGDYFIHLAWMPENRFYARVYAKLVSGRVSLGVNRQNQTPVHYSASTFSLNETHLVVVKYTFVPGDANDTVDLFVDPSTGPVEPSPLLSATDATSADATSLGAVALRQGTAGNASTQKVDGIRIGTSWSDIFPPLPDLMVSACDPDTVLTGQPVTLAVTVANQATVAASATMTRVLVDGEVKCDQIPTPVLGPGQSVQLPCTFGTLPVGPHEVQILADATGLVAEFSEVNNVLTQPLIVVDAPSGVGDDRATWETTLLGVFPNPTAGTSTIRYLLAEGSVARVEIFDAGGRRVRVLAGRAEKAGLHAAFWDGRSDSGERVGSGCYYLRFGAGNRSWTRSVVILR